jgi:molecular chaperone DnaK
VKARTEALAQASMKLGEAIYKAQADTAGGPEAGGGAGGGSAGRERDEHVVDADFEEVDDDKKKSA